MKINGHVERNLLLNLSYPKATYFPSIFSFCFFPATVCMWWTLYTLGYRGLTLTVCDVFDFELKTAYLDTLDMTGK